MLNQTVSISSSLYVSTDFVEEDQTPSLLRATVVDPYTVQLEWRVSPINCEVVGYAIYYEENGAPTLVNVTGGGTTQALLKNLQPSSAYVIFISALTTSGNVLTSDRSVRVQTPAG